MSREQINSVVVSVAGSLLLSMVMFAGRGWFAERSKDLEKQVQDQELAITRMDASYSEVVKRLDRMEGKIDELVSRPARSIR
jgi:uncharacterized coiled-coil protein SlyX